MTVRQLRFTGFRNLADSVFTPGPGVNIISGNNAQGKTNLLEALWLLCGAKSFRGAKDAELPRFGAALCELAMEFESQGRAQSAVLRIAAAASQKNAERNGVKLKRPAELGEAFCAVVFSPDHLELIKREPKHRRALLDGSLCQAYTKYARILESYEKILRQRAFLLRDIAAHGPASQLLSLLDAWDESLIEYGGYITWMRGRYVAKLARYAAESYAGISGGRESFRAEYAAACHGQQQPGGEGRREEITALLRQAVRDARVQDIRHGASTVGPHRDDLAVTVNGRAARAFGSQGQQRSCVLALKLAECRILAESHGEPPVVLLDDVMSELDEGRRRYLLNDLSGRQIFITCCGREHFGSFAAGSRLFEMKHGILTAEEN